MLPISIVASQKLLAKLTQANALQAHLTSLAAAANLAIPAITSGQVLLSSASPEMGDRNIQFGYPRVCIYSSGLKNSQVEKFRLFSGQITLVAEIWASADLVTETDQWIHFYVESVGEILQANIGTWGDGMFYSGAYDVQFQPPKAGGLGFVESAKLTLILNVSLG